MARQDMVMWKSLGTPTPGLERPGRIPALSRLVAPLLAG
jgi:hypothetical protein